jgi:hypothetical protein
MELRLKDCLVLKERFNNLKKLIKEKFDLDVATPTYYAFYNFKYI